MTSIDKKTTSKQTIKMAVSIILLLLGILTQKDHPWMMLHMQAFINRPFTRFLFPLLLKGSKQTSIDTAGKSVLKIREVTKLEGDMSTESEDIAPQIHYMYIVNFKDVCNCPLHPPNSCTNVYNIELYIHGSFQQKAFFPAALMDYLVPVQTVEGSDLLCSSCESCSCTAY